jgi:hypothetical protein
MKRREFLLASLAATLPLSKLAPACPGRPEPMRTGLVIHAIALRVPQARLDGGVPLTLPWKTTASPYGVALARGDTLFHVGDRLGVRLLDASMGHYRIGLFHGELGMRVFDSLAVGSLLERGETLAAVVGALSGGHLRIDVVLERQLRPGESIALLPPALDNRGTLAYLLPAADAASLRAGWHPLRAAPWQLATGPKTAQRPVRRAGDAMDTEIVTAPARLQSMPNRHRWIFNDSPWTDFDPAAAVLVQGGRDVAVLPYRLETSIERLLLRGERVEARALRPGALGEVNVDLRLVA